MFFVVVEGLCMLVLILLCMLELKLMYVEVLYCYVCRFYVGWMLKFIV